MHSRRRLPPIRQPLSFVAELVERDHPRSLRDQGSEFDRVGTGTRGLANFDTRDDEMLVVLSRRKVRPLRIDESSCFDFIHLAFLSLREALAGRVARQFVDEHDVIRRV
jgi:hypothetical protein